MQTRGPQNCQAAVAPVLSEGPQEPKEALLGL